MGSATLQIEFQKFKNRPLILKEVFFARSLFCRTDVCTAVSLILKERMMYDGTADKCNLAEIIN